MEVKNISKKKVDVTFTKKEIPFLFFWMTYCEDFCENAKCICPNTVNMMLSKENICRGLKEDIIDLLEEIDPHFFDYVEEIKEKMRPEIQLGRGIG